MPSSKPNTQNFTEFPGKTSQSAPTRPRTSQSSQARPSAHKAQSGLLMIVVITGILSVIGFIYFVGFFSQGTSFIKSQTEAACLKTPKLPFCEEGSEAFYTHNTK